MRGNISGRFYPVVCSAGFVMVISQSSNWNRPVFGLLMKEI